MRNSQLCNMPGIETLVGRIGSGKSLTAVRRMCKYMANGGHCYTNIKLKIDQCSRYAALNWQLDIDPSLYHPLTPDQISMFHRYTASGTPDCHTLVVIDEAQLYFNARDWAKADREFLTFLTQCRHVHTDIIFISQSSENIDKQIRRLITTETRCRDWSKMQVGFLKFKALQLVMEAIYDYDGKTLLHREWILKEQALFDCYDSYEMVATFPRLEAVGQGKKRRSKVSGVKFGFLGFLFGLACMYLFAVHRFGNFRLENTRFHLFKSLSLGDDARSSSPSTSRPGVQRESTSVVSNFLQVSHPHVTALLERNGMQYAVDSDDHRWYVGQRQGGKKIVNVDFTSVTFEDGTRILFSTPDSSNATPQTKSLLRDLVSGGRKD